VKILDEGVADGVFPLARTEIWLAGKPVLAAGNAPEGTLFDLASITKVMATTALCLDAFETGAFAPDPGILDLLFHRSGLPAFLPLFAEALATWPELNDEGCSKETRAAARAHVVAAAKATPHAARREAVYSDLGFILLGELLAEKAGLPLDELFEQRVKTPLGLSASYRRISAALPVPKDFAPTGTTRPREPAPGQERLWTAATKPTRLAEVDDDNAWAMDGVSGHAGLFGTAHDVALFGQAVLDGRVALPPGLTWRADASTPGSTRALGFDTPSAEGASCGQRFGRAGPLGAVGHLGFTGNSLWIDLDRKLVVVLLTNRVALGRANVKIREYRPRFHDAVLDLLGL
jgi:CubicO group peptidase (beta-lactamase class C family)